MKNNLIIILNFFLLFNRYLYFFQIPYLPEIFLRMQDLKFLNVIFRTKKQISPYSEEDKEAYRFTFGKPGKYGSYCNLK